MLAKNLPIFTDFSDTLILLIVTGSRPSFTDVPRCAFYGIE